MINEISTLNYKAKYWVKFQEFFVNSINYKLKGIQFDLIVYDEVEYFRRAGDKLFAYPYQPRMTVVDNFKVNFTKDAVDYDFHMTTTNF
jgi:hypothetical protein